MPEILFLYVFEILFLCLPPFFPPRIFVKGVIRLIDTVKLLTPISKEVFDIISGLGDRFIKTQQNNIVFDKCSVNIPSYSTSLHISVDDVTYLQPFLVVEGSPHKIFKKQNAYDGFYNLTEILHLIVDFINKNTSLNLPIDENLWFVAKVDITRCFDLGDNQKVCNYINSLSFCSYPRRKNMFFQDESVYFSGTTNTLKIYNKFLECKKNDLSKLRKLDFFDLDSHLKKISGYVRFECSIKPKTLKKIFSKKNTNIPKGIVSNLNLLKGVSFELPCVSDVNYTILEEYWQCEFSRLLKISSTSKDVLSFNTNTEVFNQLINIYGGITANRLYSFYLVLKSDGYSALKRKYSSSTFYRYINQLKSANINLANRCNFNASNFNIFSFREVF